MPERDSAMDDDGTEGVGLVDRIADIIRGFHRGYSQADRLKKREP